MKKLLVDADILVYRAAIAAERTLEYEPECFVLMSYQGDAQCLFDDELSSLLEKAGVRDFILCFSSEGNFRKDIYHQYKSHRKGIRKPLCFHSLRDAIFENHAHSIFTKPRLEADDCIGILATQSPDEYIVWSDDKDLWQIPGQHLTEDGITNVTQTQADYSFYLQTLTGDSADGYPGCPGIGPKKAETILSVTPHWPRVVEAYKKQGLTEDDALVQARVARILRADQWNNQTSEPILWNPPTIA